MRYGFIRGHAVEFAVTRMCRVLEVSKAGYYAWRRRSISRRSWLNERLKEEIRAIHAASRATYGSPRVHESLMAMGRECSLGRVARIMRREGIRGKKRRLFRVTTDSRHSHPVTENVLKRQFGVESAGSPNRVWAADISVPQQAA
ncbi:MAG: IS3 family transposase [Gemmatimonadaceae bacterium]